MKTKILLLSAEEAKLQAQLHSIKENIKVMNFSIFNEVKNELAEQIGDNELRFKPTKTQKNEKFLAVMIDGMRINAEGVIEVCEYHTAQKRIGGQYQWVDNWIAATYRLSAQGLVSLLRYTETDAACSTIQKAKEQETGIELPIRI